MVRAPAAILILALSSGPAPAAAADWTRAGGSLFVGQPVIPPEPSDPAEAHVAAPVQPFADSVEAAALRHGLDPKLIHALITVESAYQPAARSSAGAVGLTQLMPATAAELGVIDRADPAENVRAGVDYLARQVIRFGDLKLALAAYNAGPSRVARLGRVPAIPETEAYVDAVLACFLALAAGREVRAARDCRAEIPRP